MRGEDFKLLFDSKFIFIQVLSIAFYAALPLLTFVLFSVFSPLHIENIHCPPHSVTGSTPLFVPALVICVFLYLVKAIFYSTKVKRGLYRIVAVANVIPAGISALVFTAGFPIADLLWKLLELPFRSLVVTGVLYFFATFAMFYGAERVALSKYFVHDQASLFLSNVLASVSLSVYMMLVVKALLDHASEGMFC